MIVTMQARVFVPIINDLMFYFPCDECRYQEELGQDLGTSPPL